ncbi:hypothetical protein F4810DRAFT_714263 [Camillea tinctor]|nr:hypothetical protein F4810DRAFT_714263 [Camillea tinctor]
MRLLIIILALLGFTPYPVVSWRLTKEEKRKEKERKKKEKEEGKQHKWNKYHRDETHPHDHINNYNPWCRFWDSGGDYVHAIPTNRDMHNFKLCLKSRVKGKHAGDGICLNRWWVTVRGAGHHYPKFCWHQCWHCLEQSIQHHYTNALCERVLSGRRCYITYQPWVEPGPSDPQDPEGIPWRNTTSDNVRLPPAINPAFGGGAVVIPQNLSLFEGLLPNNHSLSEGPRLV